jgi:hypothetical protein
LKNVALQAFKLCKEEQVGNNIKGLLVNVYILYPWQYHIKNKKFNNIKVDNITNQNNANYIFRNQPIRNKNCLWRPCLLTDWN